ncbi:DNA internalization-related competence protein ComEC/Rec2 [Oceanobacillus sp. M65]|uniref:DNA internalization-related competence protein ComEC/Rec2 n=1 Tax=Oceanobacillus sp. M65 TaxID=3457435 RepID=UPI003FCDA49E
MKGNWHIVAMAVTVSIITVLTSNYLFVTCYIIWLGYLLFQRRLRKVTLLLASAFLCFFLLYIPKIQDSQPGFSGTSLPEQSFIGQINGPIEKNPTHIQFTFEDNATNQRYLVMYFQNDASETLTSSHLKSGATCEFQGVPERPNPSTNPGEFNYRDYLASKKITYQVNLNALHDVTCTGQDLFHRFYTLRENLSTYIDKRVSSNTSAWMKGLVLGDDSAIPEDTIELFQRWSLSHLLAISGLHVGLFVAFLYFALLKLNLLTKEKAQWLILFLLPAYAVVAGGEPSIWRASMMVLCFILLRKFKRAFSYTDVLSFVFLLFVLINPYMVYHVGFQLSFLVTLGLLLSQKWLSNSNSLIEQGLKISFVAQMMILPLLFHHFYIFQPLSVLVNTLVVPYFSILIIPSMFLFLLISPFPIINLFDKLFSMAQNVLLTLLTFFDEHVNYPWTMDGMAIEFVAVYYGLFFVFMYYVQNKDNKNAFVAGSTIVIFVSYFVAIPYFSPYGVVTMLDIGQGDAYVVELPYRKGVFLIDAGAGVSFPERTPTNSKYKQIIQPYLKSRGVTKLDAIIITHKDIDHSGSVQYLAEEYKTDQIIVSDYYEIDQRSKELWNQKNIAVQRVKQGDQLNLGGQQLHVLAPMNDKGSPNENSIVLLAELGGQSWLFTGDIGREEEKELMRSYEHLSIDVLKVAHHGSSSSSDDAFLDHIEPEIGLISAGRNNRYGHPTEEVIAGLENIEATILRTDKDGAVQFVFTQEAGTFYKFLP